MDMLENNLPVPTTLPRAPAKAMQRPDQVREKLPIVPAPPGVPSLLPGIRLRPTWRSPRRDCKNYSINTNSPLPDVDVTR